MTPMEQSAIECQRAYRAVIEQARRDIRQGAIEAVRFIVEHHPDLTEDDRAELKRLDRNA